MNIPTAAFVFGAGVLTVLYVLVGYPCLLAVLALRERNVRKQFAPTPVTIVMPVHNGERWIAAKLESIRQLDYPPALMQTIVIDDGSTDRTRDLVQKSALSSLEVISLPRVGKAAALNAGIERASGRILVFTDVRQRLAADSVRRLIECFADDTVGVASGELIILAGETQEEADIGLYWRYEKWIRKRLSRLDSVLGASGCLYAMRRELAVTLPSNTLVDDMYLPLAALFRGYRLIFDERARAFDHPTALQSEFRRKVRTLAGVYQIIGAYPRLLVPFTRMWLHFVSYKLGRLLLPYALIAIAVSSFGLPHPWNIAAIVAQGSFYGLAAADRWMPRPISAISSLPRTFVVLMGAALCAPVFLAVNHRRAPGWSITEVRPAVPSSVRRRM